MKKRAMAILVLLCFLALLCEPLLFYRHECAGEGCRICALFSGSAVPRASMGSCGAVTFILLALSAAGIGLCGFAPCEKKSLVERKVKLSD